MAVHSAVVQVGTSTPGLIYPADPDGAHMHIRADKAIYLGNSNMTAANGYLLPEGGSLCLEIGPDELVYALSTDGRAKIYVIVTLNQ